MSVDIIVEHEYCVKLFAKKYYQYVFHKRTEIHTFTNRKCLIYWNETKLINIEC